MRVFTLLCILLNYQAFSQLQIPSFSSPFSINRPGKIEYIEYGNLNGDDYLDAVFTTYGNPYMYYTLGTSDKGFGQIQKVSLASNAQINYHPLNLKDLDNDGRDEAIVYGDSGYLTVFKYEDAAVEELYKITLDVTNDVQRMRIIDLDSDGTQEIVLIFFDLGSIHIIKNVSDAFTSQTVEAGLVNSGQLEIVDFNDDQKLDIIVTDTYYNDLKIFEGSGASNFINVKTFNFENSVSSFCIADVSGDGLNDIFIVPSNSLGVKSLINLGDNNFLDDNIFVGKLLLKGITIADITNDGQKDILLGDYGSTLIILENQTDNVFIKSEYPMGSYLSTEFINYIDTNSDNTNEIIIAGSTISSFSLENDQPVLQHRLPVNSSLTDGRLDDLNQDGILDIVAVSATSGFLNIYYGLGNSVFADPVSLYAVLHLIQ